MKNKKVFTSIIVMLMLVFQMTTVKATSFSDSYINKIYTPKMNLIVNDVLSDNAKKIVSQYSIYIVDPSLPTFLSLNPNKSKTENDMVEGMTHPEDKEVIVHNQFDSIRITFHEIGHTIDFDQDQKLGKYSQTFEYKQIATEETNRILQLQFGSSIYFKTDITEQFADSFSLFVTRPNDLKMAAPKTYDYFQKLNLVKEDFQTYSIRTNTPKVLDPTKIPVAVNYKDSIKYKEDLKNKENLKNKESLKK